MSLKFCSPSLVEPVNMKSFKKTTTVSKWIICYFTVISWLIFFFFPCSLRLRSAVFGPGILGSET